MPTLTFKSRRRVVIFTPETVWMAALWCPESADGDESWDGTTLSFRIDSLHMNFRRLRDSQNASRQRRSQTTRVKVVQTSSNSCSAGGVFGREGATDSAARRTIAEGKVGVKGKESAEFSVCHFRGKIRMSSWKGITIS